MKCLSNPVYKYRDCTLPINHWIPDACPAQCLRDAQAPGCARVKSCTAAGFYAAVGTDVDNLGKWNEQLRGSGAGHIFYRFKTKAYVMATHCIFALYRQRN